MDFLSYLAAGGRIVYDGPMETRIEYGTDLKLDKEMSIFALCDTEPGRQALTALYRRDIEAAGGPIGRHCSIVSTRLCAGRQGMDVASSILDAMFDRRTILINSG